MSITPRRSGRSAPSLRRGFTLKESIVVAVILAVVAAIGMPVLVMVRERARRIACEGNLRNVGQAIDRYATADSAGSLPIGSRFALQTKSSGTSWWLEILPFADADKTNYRWNTQPDSGDFDHPYTPNANTEFADGFRIPLFFCPASPLPLFNDPLRHMSAENRALLKGRRATGIAVPMYTAVAGSAPDLRDYNPTAELDRAAGRNTSDGPWGILSASGVFPPNRRLRRASVLDQKDKTIMLVEQSDYARDTSVEPPDRFDIRSAWPKGAFMGATGNYDELSTTALSLNGDGSERCWNITSVRYPLNMRDIKQKRGIFTDPAPPRPEKEGDPTPPTPPYPIDGYGPGHNQPIISAHPEGAQVLMFDGSVHFLNEKMDLALLLRMCTRDDRTDIAE
ncbi:MAG: DUF1559 domain-containing protein [Planctomycetia bacterium]|nr:DUF1559 domain-containing protein [Planctomycetia bacterium]